MNAAIMEQNTINVVRFIKECKYEPLLNIVLFQIHSALDQSNTENIKEKLTDKIKKNKTQEWYLCAMEIKKEPPIVRIELLLDRMTTMKKKG